MNQPLTLKVRSGDGAGVIEIHGELNASADEALSDAYTQAAEAADAIVLNFEGLEYMNSSGIGLLVTLLIRANRQKKRLIICGLTDHYRHIFQITRLDDAIAIHGTEAEALASVR
jgi:anti-sigma B factor antagonist